MAKKFYAVRNGRKTGIYKTWNACKEQVQGFQGATFKGFETLEEANAYMNIGLTSKAVFQQAEKVALDVEVTAYVDGSYHKTTQEFSYGAIIFYRGEQLSFAEKFADVELATMRNVAGELKGAEKVMQFCVEHGVKSVAIYYDYMGIEKWCTGEWKTNKEGTKAYKAFCDKIKGKLEIHFVKVAAHTGDTYNEAVDKLAKEALGIK